MPATFNWFTTGREAILADGIDGMTVKVALLENAASPDGTEQFLSELAADETDGANYVRKTLGSAALSIVSTTVKYDGADVVWSSLGTGTNPIRYAIVFAEITNDAASPMLFYIDFGADQSPGGSDFTISWNSSGIFTS